ncbi:TWiK family of potassium channels protein 18-like [Ptychodera flava]|uniref:TWiK family of potassium channels protein 18-like n=1 Tax=Ptychodera flava TaxID=63121 RepID=UPI003969CA25
MAKKKQSALKKFRDVDWKSVRNTVFLFVGVIAYIVAGGLMFHMIEGRGNTQYSAHNLTDLRYQFAQYMWNVSLGMNENEFIVFAAEELEIFRKLLEDAELEVAAANFHLKWNYLSACFFCITVISTIGYGTVTPITQGGRLACMFYAFLGIPLFVIFLAKVGKLISTALQFLYHKFLIARKRCRELVDAEKEAKGPTKTETVGLQCDDLEEKPCEKVAMETIAIQTNDNDRYLPVKEKVEEVIEEEEEEEEDEDRRTVVYNDTPVTLFVIICICLVIGGSVVVTSLQSDWTYLDSFYFTVITFTTVGFGDLVIHDATTVTKDQLLARQSFLAVYIVIGLVVMSITLNLAQEQLNATAQRIADKKLEGKEVCNCLPCKKGKKCKDADKTENEKDTTV